MAKNVPDETLKEFQRRVFLSLDEAAGNAYPASEFEHDATYAETLQSLESAAYWFAVASNRMLGAARTARKRAKSE